MDHPPIVGALETGRNCWRIVPGNNASVVIDADDYFNRARAAMVQARHRIMLVGWDFDARINLGDPAPDGGPATVGDFILWLVDRTPGLEIFVLRWGFGAIKSITRGNTVVKLAQWMMHPRVEVRLDSAHPTGSSHHQKIVVIDDCFAFCGGIDMTAGRWDTRQHQDDDKGRIGPGGEPTKPWHDATSAIEGPAAAALADLCRTRWERAGGTRLVPVVGGSDCWPRGLPVDFPDVTIAIARSEPEMPDWAPTREIERLYLDMIARARRSIYAESQYFASRRVAEALVRRLEEPDGPDVVIINPLTAEGWLEPIAMDSARARIYEALKSRDPHGRLRMFHVYTDGGEPIYVHAKIMIVDDFMIKVGSSNFNNRSMRLDTECDIVIDATLPGNEGCSATIAAIRDGLIAEHLDCPAEIVTAALANERLITAIDRLRAGRDRVRDYVVPDLSETKKWLADNEVLDPEGPDEMFESLSDRGLFRNIHWFGK
ncbi:phospholipase D-like domain-containing protein [Polymorphobacter fuscus]|uniref:Phospholipase D n=1 Tax=Sandarakinorhabdus fusca TaxID=1439888 RepID=A0A7C9KHE7_9SPHN|nr:phospholipase D-like domain-containing protein [Polymorphobacter fuscus]KAB7648821.1 phospholipase [Polymorphobacter fuscus]MQT16401.1 phospholipase [Polymorphobacter fuscus]NJC07310.1 phosphatidylserine/phosphatidylglycerophosphate/cardiolipin synthase-like enzyme [Polymorphobacter fuscus]